MTDNINFEHVQDNVNFNFKNIFAENNIYEENNIHNCQYYDVDQVSEKLKKINRDHFSILSLNIQSMPGKFIEFKNFLSSTNMNSFKPAIIALQEIWNKPNYEDYNLPDYHPFHFTIRDKTGLNSNAGGGVGLWVQKSYTFESIDSLSIFIPRVFESQFIKVKTSKNKYLIFGNIYRPNTAPLANTKQFNEILKDILNKLKSDPLLKNAEDIILVGDMNINLLNYSTHQDTGVYLDTLLENGLLPLITLPTRITQSTATLLDHISTNIADDSFDTGIILSDISDHFPVFYIRYLKEQPKSKNTQTIKIRKMDENSKIKFKNLLDNTNWENIVNNYEPASAFDNFFDKINNCFESAFPERNFKPSNKNKPLNPWMTSALLTSRKYKEKLFAKKVRKPCTENKEKFKQYNKLYTSLIREARKKYYFDKFIEYSKDGKKTWETINSVIGRNIRKVDIPTLFVSNGKILSGDFEISEGFNKFFANIGPDLAKSIPNSTKHFSEYLSEECRENFVFANVTPNILLDALNKLKNKNSSGTDKISTNLLKFIFPSVMLPLCHLFNLSFKSGYIPVQMKTAKVVPIFKSGEPDNFTNYRPISLLSSFSKLLEKIAAKQIMRYLNKFALLYEHQYGFRARYNTTQPLIHLIDKIYNALNKPDSEFTLGIFIDLTKAFDTCDTNILLSKLAHYGFRGVSNNWFSNYLTGRKQFTSIRGVNSSLIDLSCGVPQGSILGPILFLILINDLPNASAFFTLLFADDTTLQLSSNNLHLLYDKANMELTNIADWFKANKLTLNVKKTKYILFRNKNKHVNFNNLNIKIENNIIERVGSGCKDTSFKFVGVHLDEFLNWEQHTKYVRGKAASAVYALSRVRNLLPSNIKYIIYNSLFRSFIEYGVIAWGRAKGGDINAIHTLQKKAVRYIDNAKYNTHTDPLFCKFKILKVPDIVDYNCGTFMYKLTNNLLPTSFYNTFTKIRNFERSLNYQLQNTTKKSLQSFPSYTLPKLWNGLPLQLKRSNSLNIFKRKYLIHLTEKYKTTCHKHNCFACRK